MDIWCRPIIYKVKPLRWEFIEPTLSIFQLERILYARHFRLESLVSL